MTGLASATVCLHSREVLLRARQAKGRRSLTGALALGAFCMLVPASAGAHFVLQAPVSWSVLDQNSGLPEKLGPCGNESMPVASVNDAGQPVITAFQEGDMITVTIHEVVPHPGHYRISLSTEFATAGDTDQAGFPEEPVVTAGETNSGTMMCPTGQIVAAGSSPCGSVPIVQNTPVAVVGGWILADDVFEHCEAFTSPQTIKVALPAGVTCKECVLQVVEFMSSHGLNPVGGCFYHHCANISISAQSVTVDAGGESGASSSSGATSGASSGGASGESSGTEGASGSLGLSGASMGAGSTMSSTPSTGSTSVSGSAPSGANSGSSSGATTSGSGGGTSSSSGGCSVLPQRGFAGGLLAAGIAAAGMMRRRRR